mmetsp:Transcript_5864/g.36359  ORF Transcript_5864/g.36359 Transcript_5864/m.36359 type:complete len:152 (+) Transcript_5864:58-513(+)
MCVVHRGRGNAKVGEEHQVVRSGDGSNLVRPRKRQAINLALAELRPTGQKNMARPGASAKITKKKSTLEGSSPLQEKMNAASCPIQKVSTDAEVHPNEAIARVSDRWKLSHHHEKVQTKRLSTPPTCVHPSPLPCHLPPGHRAILQHGPKI